MANKFDKAYQILGNYYDMVLNSLADDIIEREEAFSETVTGKAEDLAESYARRLSQITCCLGNLDTQTTKHPWETRVEQLQAPRGELASGFKPTRASRFSA